MGFENPLFYSIKGKMLMLILQPCPGRVLKIKGDSLLDSSPHLGSYLSMHLISTWELSTIYSMELKHMITFKQKIKCCAQ